MSSRIPTVARMPGFSSEAVERSGLRVYPCRWIQEYRTSTLQITRGARLPRALMWSTARLHGSIRSSTEARLDSVRSTAQVSTQHSRRRAVPKIVPTLTWLYTGVRLWQPTQSTGKYQLIFHRGPVPIWRDCQRYFCPVHLKYAAGYCDCDG